ncbi:hypothetical protein [Polaromonas sp.]|uniref:hypothetical protein n=1 Tax=Polaromonas sp. TaxID=1869339 RepID=UPI003BA9A4CB
MAEKSEIFTVTTPVPGVKTATLYENVWSEHIEPFHPEMVGQQKSVARTLQNPTFVCAGDSDERLMFVSHTEVATNGKPAVVIVSTTSDAGKPIVITAFGGRAKHLDKDNFEIKWPL